MKYRKKSIVIEAEQYKEGMEDGFEERYINLDNPTESWGIPTTDEDKCILVPYIKTLVGKPIITKNDWIITGKTGERYICKSDIFKDTYELVDD